MRTLADITRHKLIMFWSPACGPSLMMSQLILDLNDEIPTLMELVPIKIEDQPDEAKKYKVRYVPSFAVEVDGDLKGMLAGTATREQMIDWIAGRLAKPAEKATKKRKEKADA